MPIVNRAKFKELTYIKEGNKWFTKYHIWDNGIFLSQKRNLFRLIYNCFILIIFYLESRQLHEIQVIAINVFQWFDKSHHLSRVAQTRPPFKNSTMAASFTDSACLLILKITFKCTNFQENTRLESGSFSRTVSILGNLPICFWRAGKCT